MAQYAYVVTGTTASAIQTQIDNAHASSGDVDGGTVFLPGNTYLLEEPVYLKPNVRLQGVGSRTILKPSGANGAPKDRNLIVLNNGQDSFPHDIEICDLVLYGPGTGDEITDDVSADYYKGCGIYANDSEVENITIRNCRIENMSGCGILFRNTAAKLVNNIQISDCVLLN